MPSQPQSALTTLTAALLLAATGGLTDAIVYLNHGHVFANAMTGNVVLFGISVLNDKWPDVFRHLTPIAAYLLGVAAARVLHHSRIRRAALLALLLEIAAIAAVGSLPGGIPAIAYVPLVAFVSAFQVATFRRAGSIDYNSTFVTGNLRTVAEGFTDSFIARDPAQRFLARHKARVMGAICLCFLAGAVAGAAVAPRFPTHALLFAEPTLLGALALTRLSRKIA